MTDTCSIANFKLMIRVFQILVLSCMSLLLTGCNAPEKSKPVWEEVKLGDLAPSSSYQLPRPQLLKTINFDVHIFEIPAENISEMGNVWKSLYVRLFRFNSRYAFNANSFIVRFGQAPMLDKINDLILSAAGQRVLKISLYLSDKRPNDLTISGLDKQQTVSYVSSDGTREKAAMGPGLLVLRIKAVKIPGSRGVCIVVAQPVFTQPMRSSIPALADRVKLHEFAFSSASFGLKMGPGDFVVLGPKEYISDGSTLGGLLFSKPEGSLFFNGVKHKVPKRKPSVRIFLLVCTSISD